MFKIPFFFHRALFSWFAAMMPTPAPGPAPGPALVPAPGPVPTAEPSTSDLVNALLSMPSIELPPWSPAKKAKVETEEEELRLEDLPDSFWEMPPRKDGAESPDYIRMYLPEWLEKQQAILHVDSRTLIIKSPAKSPAAKSPAKSPAKPPAEPPAAESPALQLPAYGIGGDVPSYAVIEQHSVYQLQHPELYQHHHHHLHHQLLPPELCCHLPQPFTALLSPPKSSRVDLTVAMAKYEGYTLDDRVKFENNVSDKNKGKSLLMVKSATLKSHAHTLVYTFGGKRKNDIMFGLLEQMNKCKGCHVEKLRNADVTADLTTGIKAEILKTHVQNGVVLLPLSAPRGLLFTDADSMMDPKLSKCFTAALPGNLVILDYESTSGKTKGQRVILGWGVVSDRPYVNSLDPEVRVRMYEDDPTQGSDNLNQMVLPVHVAGIVEGCTWDDLFERVMEPFVQGYAGIDQEALKVLFRHGLPSLDHAAADLQRCLPEELQLFVPSQRIDNLANIPVTHDWASAWEANMYLYRSAALYQLATFVGGADLYSILVHMHSSPDLVVALPPSLRCCVKRPAHARIGHILKEAAKQATQRFGA